MNSYSAQRVVLVAPITGLPSNDDFRIERYEVPAPGDGQFLVRNVFCSVDPGTRSRLSAGVSYTSNLKAGEQVSSFAMGRVVQSLHPGYQRGDWVIHASGWTDHQLCDGRGYIQKVPAQWTGADQQPPALPLSCWIGVLGIPGMTAWFGLHRVGVLKAGERVLVSSAAGPVGSTAGQIARLRGAARVVGIAGGPQKCDWLRDRARFDAAVDYKAAQALADSHAPVSTNVSGVHPADYAAHLQAALAAASPDGYDVFYDNIGNSLIDIVIPLMRPFGRIIISGTMADYNRRPEDIPGLRNTRHFIAKRLRMEGILVFDDRRQFADAQAEIAQWMARGEIVWREERFEGIEQLPQAFVGLFTGESFGRRIVQLGPQELT